MLLYHPFYDSRHCVFRMLCLLEALGESIEWQRLRLLDFYVLFPELLAAVRLPRGATKIRKYVYRDENVYDRLPDEKVAFVRIRSIQEDSLHNLISRNLVTVSNDQYRIVARTEIELPADLKRLILLRIQESKELFDFLTTTFSDLELYGENGLRSRTSLFDFRYDL